MLHSSFSFQNNKNFKLSTIWQSEHKEINEQTEIDKTSGIDLYTDLFVFINKLNVIPVKADMNHLRVRGNIINLVSIDHEQFFLLRINSMYTRNFSIAYVQVNKFQNRKKVLSILDLSSFEDDICVLLRVNNINKIINPNLEKLEIISKAINKSKTEINFEISWENFDNIKLVEQINNLPSFASIKLKNLKFINKDIKSKFWKSIFRFKNAVIMLAVDVHIKISKNLIRNNQSIGDRQFFTFWKKQKEVSIKFFKVLAYMHEYINIKNVHRRLIP